MTEILLVDQDGPLVDWEGSIYEQLLPVNPELAQRIQAASAERDFFQLQQICETDEEREQFWKVGNSPGFYRHLKPIEGGFEAMRMALEMGIEVFVCTTPTPFNPTCHSDKVASIAAMAERAGEDPILWGRRVVLTQDKTLVQGTVLVDDKPDITGVVKPTWTHVPFNYPYNSHLEGPRLHSWEEKHWKEVLLPLLGREA